MATKYTKELLEEIVSKATSWAQVCRSLGIKPMTGSQAFIKRRVIKLNIPYSHFLGQAWNKGRIHGPRRPIEDYLSNKYPISSDALKKRLIREGFKKRNCESCGASKWLDGEIPIDLHHIDGNHFNNTLSNLEILCPNCHTFGDAKHRSEAKPPKIRASNPKGVKISTICPQCGLGMARKSRVCFKCYNLKKRKVSWPSGKELKTMVWSHSVSAIARKFGVSDNAVAKWCKGYGINKPGRGYWAKQKSIADSSNSRTFDSQSENKGA